VGICGSFIATRFADLFEAVRAGGLMRHLPVGLSEGGLGQVESLLHPEVQAVMPETLRRMVQTAVVEGVGGIFGTVTVVAGLCLLLCLVLPGEKGHGHQPK
jgi:hypothetical protein